MLTFQDAKQQLMSAFAPLTCTPSKSWDGSLSLLFRNPGTEAVETFVTAIGPKQWQSEVAITTLIVELRLEARMWSRSHLFANDLTLAAGKRPAERSTDPISAPLLLKAGAIPARN